MGCAAAGGGCLAEDHHALGKARYCSAVARCSASSWICDHGEEEEDGRCGGDCRRGSRGGGGVRGGMFGGHCGCAVQASELEKRKEEEADDGATDHPRIAL